MAQSSLEFRYTRKRVFILILLEINSENVEGGLHEQKLVFSNLSIWLVEIILSCNV